MKAITSNTALDAYQRMAVTQVSGARAPAKPEATVPQRQSGEAANVTISREARQLAAEASSSVDTQKVEGLKAQIQAGTYQVDAQRVAARMLGVG
ncbi:MAG: flagellar biosynthesis anti-sigma factor FlgM [Polyangiaceae bacterium]|nr:flagellar biosynthesis anti-sigma factor FlgM [Polyangiaceae bacterium]